MRRIFALALLLGLVLCSHTPAFAAGVAHQQPAGKPQISILSPKKGTTVADTTIIVEVVLLNFKLVPSNVPLSEFGQHSEANHPNEGHIQLLLDVGGEGTAVVTITHDQHIASRMQRRVEMSDGRIVADSMAVPA